ncbi:hypothetical protein Tco_1092589 [Tanacetum coccineum]|uniref:Uncharacterized protein n=1 Tax=Tanacetum coccineum TaxID=301880 RepID=A0ABQ5IAD6_9ASTR
MYTSICVGFSLSDEDSDHEQAQRNRKQMNLALLAKPRSSGKRRQISDNVAPCPQDKECSTAREADSSLSGLEFLSQSFLKNYYQSNTTIKMEENKQ